MTQFPCSGLQWRLFMAGMWGNCTVYFDDGSNDKCNPTNIKVINCHDEYCVYYLPDVPGCNQPWLLYRVKTKFAIAVNIYFVCVQSVFFSSVKTVTPSWMHWCWMCILINENSDMVQNNVYLSSLKTHVVSRRTRTSLEQTQCFLQLMLVNKAITKFVAACPGLIW